MIRKKGEGLVGNKIQLSYVPLAHIGGISSHTTPVPESPRRVLGNHLKESSHQLTRYLVQFLDFINLRSHNTFARTTSEDCRFQSELSVGSLKDRQVRANETAVDGLVSTSSSITNPNSSAIQRIEYGAIGRGRGGITELSGSLLTQNTTPTPPPRMHHPTPT